MSSTPRGSAPREGLELVLMKMGHAGPPLEPHRRLQAGKSGDPRSQNADTNNLSNSTKASVEIVAKIMWQYMAKIVTIQTSPSW